MKKTIKKLFFGKQKYQRFFYWLLSMATEGLNIGTGGRDIQETGEIHAIKKVLQGKDMPYVFDVGAQGGRFTEVCHEVNQMSRVYMFEPCRRDFLELNKKWSHNPLFNVALGSKNETKTLYTNDVTGMSSLYRRGMKNKEKTEVITLDYFCNHMNIPRVTLLKMDVEGHELEVLKGAKKMLPKIQAIIFEYGMASLDARIQFRDIFNYLEDYDIYRILPEGLWKIDRPTKIEEIPFTTNYLAIRKV